MGSQSQTGAAAPITRLHVGPRMSEAAVVGGLCFLAGQVASNPTEDTGGQTKQVLAAIDQLLEEAGTDRTRIVSTTIYLRDIADFAAMNAVWDAWVPAGHTPPRATVQAVLARPEYRVEIQVVAAL